MSDLSENALQIFKTLYSKEGESVDDTFRRVAKVYAKNKDEEDLAYQLQKDNVWRGNTPVYFNAGKKPFIPAACFVSGLDDSMDSIYDVANIARKIFQIGSGVGIPIGNLREVNAPIYEGGTIPEGKSSGPITFLKLYNAVGETTKSGGRVRRAAIMGTMPVWHPDILNFIRAKEIDGQLSNMNLSVTITDKFMQCLEDNVSFSLHTPYDGSKVKDIDPNIIWDEIVKMSWKTAEPGVMFVDTINRMNILRKVMLINTSNPCGEQPLPPYFLCNLSMINVAKFVVDRSFDFDKLFDAAYKITKLMDNIIDIMDYPDEKFRYNTLGYRPIGIGMAGLSDAMFLLDIPYNSKRGCDFASEVMRTITHASIRRSAELAKEHGPILNYNTVKNDAVEIIEKLIYKPDDEESEKTLEMVKKYGIRNSQHTTIAPTGTCALSCDCSYGMEPCFGLVFQKNIIDGSKMIVVNQIFEQRFKNEPWYNQDLIDKIFANGGSLKNLRGIPKEIREVFVVAHDIKWKDRIDMQAVLQHHVSTSISSTVNLPFDIDVHEISDLFKYAYKKELKGVTIYRDGCKKGQPILFKKENDEIQLDWRRPNKMPACIYRVETGDGTVYIGVSTDNNNKPMEIFLIMGESGSLVNGLIEALGKITSVGLQHGVPLNIVIKQLSDIKSAPCWFRFEETDERPTQILSIPDAISKLLKRYYADYKVKNTSTSKSKCPICGDVIIEIYGCSVCNSCGYSKCS